MTALECEREEILHTHTHTQPSKILRLPHVEEGGGEGYILHTWGEEKVTCCTSNRRRAHILHTWREEDDTYCTCGWKEMLHLVYVEGREEEYDTYIGGKGMIHLTYVEVRE